MFERNPKSAIVGGLVVGAALAVLLTHLFTKHPLFLRGVVLTSGLDPTKELPLADVEISVVGRTPAREVRSDTSGYFNIPITWRVPGVLRVTLRFRRPGYQPLDLDDVTGDQLYIAHMIPTERVAPVPTKTPQVVIDHVVAQYSINTTTTINIGSAVKTFKVSNVANVACKGSRFCSPDGKWKAARGTAVIDAGLGNEFHNARASCIAGPCPFTQIEDNHLSRSAGSQTLTVSALNWSDTATFLFEAEVYKQVTRDALRQSYPVVFDRALTFTLPAAAEGVSIEAELNGGMIVFPLGPALLLSWANCQLLVNKDQTKVFRCELKPGYRFAQDARAAEISLEQRP